MFSDEAPLFSEPQKDVKVKNAKNAKKVYRFMAYFLVIAILTLAANNFIIYSRYSDTREQFKDAFLRVNSITDENDNLIAVNENLKSDYIILKEEFGDIFKMNEESNKKLEELELKLEELEKINKELTEDNIELQNTLKKAASVGIKPQNFTVFNDLSSRGSIERGEYVGEFLGTAYTPSKGECGNDMGITNSGKPIIPGVSIAIDNKYWPFGTIFYIKGLGYAVAMDTGNAIKGKYRFDFAVFDRDFAKKLGTGYWDVYLVKLGTGKVEEVAI